MQSPENDSAREKLLSEGRLLPVMEEFYSIQGEGHNTGQAAYFIRIGGCDLGCRWCDVKESWNPAIHPLIETDKIIINAGKFPAKAVVVTGGEPLMYNLNYLCAGLKLSGIKIFLETSGAYPLSGQWDWICLSPKKNNAPVENICKLANELKVIIFENDDFVWAEQVAGKVNRDCLLYLQPEWSRCKTNLPDIIEYIKQNPKWKISIQAHKYMNIP